MRPNAEGECPKVSGYRSSANPQNLSERKMPSKIDVRKYWAPHLVKFKKFDSIKEAMEEDYCFACGMLNGPTELAHIIPRWKLMNDEVMRIHCLCHDCHIDSEFLEDRKYWRWFLRQNGLRMLASFSMRRSSQMRQAMLSKFFKL